MANYKIITDSACDLPQQMQKELDVLVTPLYVTLKGENLPDTVADDKIKGVYDALRAGEVAVTCAANPQAWQEIIEPVLKSGEDALVIAFSSGLSTTYQSAVIAADELADAYPDRKIRVVDGLCAALGQGLLVYHTCKMRDSGLDLDALAAWVEENKFHLCHWFTVDDLVYLKRGGRVSAASAMLGTMLNIKPVLHVDNDGKLINMQKVRGRKASIDAMVKKMVELGEGWDNEIAFISHADCLDEAEKLKALVQEKTGVKEVFIGNLGAVIGAHAGPGTLALFFMGSER